MSALREAAQAAIDELESFSQVSRGHAEVFAERISKSLRAALAQPAEQAQPVAWRDHVEQRLRTWRQRKVNRNGDQLALDDFMDTESMEDLIDFVCDEWSDPPVAAAPARLTDEDFMRVWCKELDTLRSTRVHELGGVTTSIIEGDDEVLRILRVVESEVRKRMGVVG